MIKLDYKTKNHTTSMKRLKQILTLTTVVFFAFSINACGDAKKQDNEKSTTTNNAPDSEITQASQESAAQGPEITKQEAQQTISAYLKVKDALIQTDAEAARKAAEELVSALNKSENDLLKKIRLDAQHIAETKDAAHQREHFDTLSDNLYKLVNDTDANEATLYRQFCPMAKNNKGAYWLSAEKEVRNPYFGDKMLKCGSVQETIN